VAELEKEMPDLYRQLVALRDRPGNHYREVQDYEYTIEKGVLYCLQTRNGKMNAAALVRTSVEMVNDGLIDKRQALMRIQPEMLEQLLFPRLDPKAKAVPVARGPACLAGRRLGHCRVRRRPRRAARSRRRKGHPGARGDQAGGHPRLLRLAGHPHLARRQDQPRRRRRARGMGKPCVAGAEGIHVDVHLRQAIVGDKAFGEGTVVTIDGTTGNVYFGEVPMIEAEFSPASWPPCSAGPMKSPASR
jgi:pyruvate,orthophosphate dikinase